MLAYAAGRRLTGKRQSSPHALMLVISAHVALIAVVMSAKMELPPRVHPRSIPITEFPIDPSPPPERSANKAHPTPAPNPISHLQPNVPLPLPDPVHVNAGPSADLGPIVGGDLESTSSIPTPPIAFPVHHDARLLTPASELRPPYPASKILSEEEATLRLKLTISDTGRVVSVDPVGAADREFLDAARRYLVAHWRYQPAMDDGRAVTSSTVITLRFQLDG